VGELIHTVLAQQVAWRTAVVHDASATLDISGHVGIDVLVVEVIVPGNSVSALADAPEYARQVPCADLCLDAILPKRPVECVPISILDMGKCGHLSFQAASNRWGGLHTERTRR
jgi:hypothetical protein